MPELIGALFFSSMAVGALAIAVDSESLGIAAGVLLAITAGTSWLA